VNQNSSTHLWSCNKVNKCVGAVAVGEKGTYLAGAAVRLGELADGGADGAMAAYFVVAGSTQSG
jgi:hypothetical protein